MVCIFRRVGGDVIFVGLVGSVDWFKLFCRGVNFVGCLIIDDLIFFICVCKVCKVCSCINIIMNSIMKIILSKNDKYRRFDMFNLKFL